MKFMKLVMKWWNLWLEITISIEIISNVNVPMNKYKELQLNFKLKVQTQEAFVVVKTCWSRIQHNKFSSTKTPWRRKVITLHFDKNKTPHQMISLNFGYVIHHYNIKCSLYFHDIAECVRLRRDESRKFCLIDFSMELQYKRFYCSYIFQIISRL